MSKPFIAVNPDTGDEEKKNDNKNMETDIGIQTFLALTATIFNIYMKF